MNPIAELRNQRCMTQSHLARAAGVSINTVKNAESGRRVSKETLLCLAAVLDVHPKDLEKAATHRPAKRLTRMETWISKRLPLSIAYCFVLLNAAAFVAGMPILLFIKAVQNIPEVALFYGGLQGQFQLLVLILLLGVAPFATLKGFFAAMEWRYGGQPRKYPVPR